ncbi:MAG: glutamate ligase domain-containing protein, partial [Anaerolineales bacterium]
DGRRVAMLGDMLELGAHEEMGHRLVGLRAREVADVLVTVGLRARLIAETARDAGMPAGAVVELTNADDALAWLRQEIGAGDVVLVKGSRGVKMDRIVPALEALSRDDPGKALR